MNRNDKVKLMMERFVHPNSSFAEQYYADGSGKMKQGTHYARRREGTCSHTPKHERIRDCSDMVDVKFTEHHMFEHLSGKKTYAPYQIQDQRVKWLCLDVDAYEGASDEDIQQTVKNIAARVYKRFGPNSFLVENSGSKGYHVWLFFDEPLLVAYAFSLGHNLTNDIPTPDSLNIEVYPKSVSPRGIGSTVKLPLGIHRKTNARCLFVNNNFQPYEDQWEKLAGVKLIASEEVRDTVTPVEQSVRDELPKGVSHVPLCLVEIMTVGAAEGLRDDAAFRVACYLRDKGIPAALGYTLMEQWNNRNMPPLDEETLRLKHESGYDYDRNYSWRPCHLDTFDGHCLSSCVFYPRKVQIRWKDKPPEESIGEICRE